MPTLPRQDADSEQKYDMDDFRSEPLTHLEATIVLDSVRVRLENIESSQVQMAADQRRLLQLCSGIAQSGEALNKAVARLDATCANGLPKKQALRSESFTDSSALGSPKPNRNRASFQIDLDSTSFIPLDDPPRTIPEKTLRPTVGNVWTDVPSDGPTQDVSSSRTSNTHALRSTVHGVTDACTQLEEMDTSGVSVGLLSEGFGNLRIQTSEISDVKLPETIIAAIASGKPSPRSSLETSDSQRLSSSQPVGARRVSAISNSLRSMSFNSQAGAKEHIPIRDGWDKIGRATTRQTRTPGRMSLGTSANTMDLSDGIFVEKPSGRFQALSPDGSLRTTWDVTSMFMLLYDAFTVPYILAFNLSLDGVWLLFSWVTRLFWTFDLPLSLFTGFRTKDQKLEIRFEIAMVKYMKTWFPPDIIFVACDWVSLFLGKNETLQFVKNVLRVLRLVRGVRQAPRAAALWQKALLASPYKEVQLMMDIFRLVLIILWANHVVACVWYFIGREATSRTDQSWLTMNAAMFDLGGEPYRYSTALHWAMTQMTPGSMEVVPKNTTERLYNVGCLFFGLILGSSLVATLTSMMTQYRMQAEDFTKKSVQLQRYLAQLKVAPDLAMAIKLQVRIRAKEVKRLKAKDVSYLMLMSEGLKEEMHYRFYVQVFSKHVFLNLWDQVEQISMRLLCSKTVNQDFSTSDLVFKEGDVGDTMYFLIGGTLAYTPASPTPYFGQKSFTDRDEVTWCSEPALWTDWVYQGTLVAVATAEVLKISASNLQKDLNRFPKIATILKEYCIAFHRYLNEPGVVVSDLSTYGTDYYEIISTLPPDTRLVLAEPVLRHLQDVQLKTFLGTKKDVSLLEEEVSKGKSNIAFVNGEVVRTVFVVALRVNRQEDNRFLVQIGEVMREDGTLKKECSLPGSKRRERESVTDAMARLLVEDFPMLGEAVRINYQAHREHTIFSKFSESYGIGINTRYSRTIFQARLANFDALHDIELSIERKRRCSSDIVHKSTRSTRATQRTKSGQKRTSTQPSAASAKTTGTLFSEAKDILDRCEAVAIRYPEEGEWKVDHKILAWLNEDEMETISHPDLETLRSSWASALAENSRNMFRTVMPRRSDSQSSLMSPPVFQERRSTSSSHRNSSKPSQGLANMTSATMELFRKTFGGRSSS